MTGFDPTEMNLADFAFGDDDDPLRVTEDFKRWRSAAPDMHALFGRPLASAAGPHTTLKVQGKNYDVVNMASLDYLGLCTDPRMIAAQSEALAEWGSGSAGTPLVSGTSVLHQDLEAELCALTGKTGCMLFTSGFSAATGFSVAVLRRGDVAVLDQLAHMSWIDGARMAGATLATFSHNDPEDLGRVLERQEGRRRIVVVDGLYSMDGDFARLTELLDVCDTHGVGLVVDEAHSVFADGPTGAGMTERLGEMGRVRAFMGTFSKSLGSVGGFVCVDEDLAQYLRYYSHPYVFSCSLPPGTVAGIAAGVRIARQSGHLRETLAERARQFREGVQAMGLDTGMSESWVVPVILGSDRAFLLQSTRDLMEAGLYVAPIEFPAVPEDKLRMRCAINARHRVEDIDRALELIETYVAQPIRAGASP